MVNRKAITETDMIVLKHCIEMMQDLDFNCSLRKLVLKHLTEDKNKSIHELGSNFEREE